MRKRFTPSMVVSLIALTVALSGTAVAATNGLILGSQIKDHTIGASKLTPAALNFLKGRPGPSGPAGPAGASGAFDPSKVSYVTGTNVDVPSGSVVSLRADCPAGTKVIAGGGYVSIGRMSFSAEDGNGWGVNVFNDTAITLTGTYAFAVCGAP